MRAFRFLNLGLLAAMIASSAVLYAQDEKQQEDKPKQEEPKKQEESNRSANPETKRNEANPPRQEEAKPAKPEQEQKQGEAQPRQEMKPAQQESGRQEPARQENNRQEVNRQEAGRPEPAAQDNHARPAADNRRIPDDRFRANFGREHTFVMHRPEVVGGQPRFQYGGYSFALVDAWPPAWAYSDDCYVDYVDGAYFLFDTRHPGVRLALTLVM